MGKNLIQQARGKGGPRYRAPSFNYAGKAEFSSYKAQTINGKIIDFVHCRGHDAPLASIKYDDGQDILLQAPEGVRIGDSVAAGEAVEPKVGNVLPLKNIPEGTLIYNIESQPGDGGKFVRSTGGFARIESKIGDNILVVLPSKKKRTFNAKCRACIGLIAGAGRTEKPFLKAGKRFHRVVCKNKLWPSVSASSQNAVDHPFGGRSSNRHKTSHATSRNAPPGRKVGKIAPKRTGRTKR